SRLLSGLRRAVERRGGRIHERSRVVDVKEGSTVSLRVSGGASVFAEHAIVAAPSLSGPPARAVAHRTYVVAAPVPEHAVPRALYWDSDRPYHYVRGWGRGSAHWPGDQREYLVVGGEDHPAAKPSDPEPRWARLEAWMRERFPMASGVTHRWHGEVQEPADGLPSLGRDPGREGIFRASGFGGSGLTSAAVAAMVLSDSVLGRANPWSRLYDPGRPRSRAGAFVRFGLGAAKRFFGLKRSREA
ncbi:MAG: FAD-binding oxidoreductase, partial [Elusimicrobia bacterium]|nr:FAD-binding oxidoreductase [Elusimicrobiota bacterium]